MLLRAPAQPSFIERLCLLSINAVSDLYARNAIALGAAVFAAYVLATALVAVTRPDANWDMLAYLAVAEEQAITDPQQLHDFAYGTVKAAVEDHEFQLLTDDGGGYRSHMAANAQDFISLLPMYRVKYFYAEVLAAMSFVMSPVTAMRVVSAFSVVLFGGFVLLWLRSAGALALAPLFAGLLIATEFGDMARAATPDLLCSALMLGGLHFFMQRRALPTALLLFLAFLVRPDSIVPLAVFVVMVLQFRIAAKGVLAAFAASAIAYFSISAWAGHPGWWPHLYFSSIQQQLNMDQFHPAFSMIDYLKAFARSAVFAFWYNSWVGAGLIALGGWFALHRAGYALDRRAAVLFAALVVGVVAKFVVFPIHDTRIYYPHIIPLFLLLSVPTMAMWDASNASGPRLTKISRQ